MFRSRPSPRRKAVKSEPSPGRLSEPQDGKQARRDAGRSAQGASLLRPDPVASLGIENRPAEYPVAAVPPGVPAFLLPPSGPNPFLGPAPTAMSAALELQVHMEMLGQLQSASMIGLGAYSGNHYTMPAPGPASCNGPPKVDATLPPSMFATQAGAALSSRQKDYRTRCICGSKVCRELLAPFWLGVMQCKELLVSDDYAPLFAMYFGVLHGIRTFIGPWHFLPELRWLVTNTMPDQRFRAEDGGTIMPIMLEVQLVREVEMLSALYESDEQYFFTKIRDRAAGVSDDDDVKALQLTDLRRHCGMKRIDLPPPPEWISLTDGILGATAAVDDLSVEEETSMATDGSDGPDVSWDDLAEIKSDIPPAVDASSEEKHAPIKQILSSCANAEKIARIVEYSAAVCGFEILYPREPSQHTLVGVAENFAANESKIAKSDKNYSRYKPQNKKTCRVALPLYCERRNQFHVYEQEREVMRRGTLPLAARMALTASSMMSPHEQFETTLGVSTKRMEDAILPKTRLLSTDSDFEKTEGVPEHSVYFRERGFSSSQFVLARQKKGGCRVYIDTEGVVGLGKRMAFMKVGDYLMADSVALQRLNKLTDKVGQCNSACLLLPLLKHIFDRAAAEALGEKTENDAHHTAREHLNGPIGHFLQRCLDCLVEFIDFNTFDPNKSPRFAWLVWPPVSTVFESAVDPATRAHIRAINEASASRVRAENQDASDEELKRLILEREIDTLMVFYFIIIAISQVCTDDETWMMSRCILQGLPDAVSFIELLEVMPFSTLFNALFEICRGVSLNGARALTVVSIMTVCVLQYGGGLPTKPADVQRFPQVNDKKDRILNNVPHQIRHRLEAMGVPKDVIEQLCSVQPKLGVDGHVKRFLKVAAKVLLPGYGNDAAYERLAYAVADTLPPDIAVFANEILAQLSQWINERRQKKSSPANDLLLGKILGALRKESEVFSLIVDTWLASFDKKKK